MKQGRDAIRQKLSETLVALRHQRNLSKKQEKDAFEEITISQRTVTRIEQGKTDPLFTSVVLLMNLYNAKSSDILDLFGSLIADDVESSYDRTSTHIKRLDQYTKMTYYCHFYKTAKSLDRDTGDTDFMIIKTECKAENGFLSATAEHNSYEYSVKIVSPADYDYAFIYFTSTGTLKDKGIIILPFIKKIKKKFHFGIGVMLSLSMDNTPAPCFQKVLMVSQYSQKKEIKRNLHEYLKINIPLDSTDIYEIKEPDLEQRTIELYDELYNKRQKT